MFEEIKYLSKLQSCQEKSCEGRDYATLLWKTRPTETERCMSKKEINDYVKKRNYYASLLKKFKKLQGSNVNEKIKTGNTSFHCLKSLAFL